MSRICSTFGASPGLGSAFDMLYLITWLSIAFWVAVTFHFSKVIWKHKSAIVHVALLISFALALGGFNSMRLNNPLMPDGVLITGPVTVDYTVKPPVFSIGDGFGRRVLAGTEPVGGMAYTPSCVWLERGLIEAQNYTVIAGQKPLPVRSWQDRGSLSRNAIMLIENLYTRDNLAKVIQDSQVLRPLTEDERADFIKKQKCRGKLGLEYHRYQECDYVRVLD